MRIVAFTHAGPHRPRNEDALFLAGRVIAGTSTPAPLTLEVPETGALLAVIDGMGGHAGGAPAARLTARALAARDVRDLAAASTEMVKASIDQALDQAERAMREEAARDPRLRRMGAAVAGAVFGAEALVVFNCGDCRVYRQQNPYLDRLTRDHSVAQELCDQGELEEEDMRSHPRRNVLTSCVCADQEEDRQVFFRALPFDIARPRLLLCSDGVWEALALEELEDCLADRSLEAGAAELARRLLEPAEGARRDNLSFALAEAGG